MKKQLLLLMCLIPAVLYANTGRYRLMFRENPSSSIVVGWQQFSGFNPVVYYGKVDHGTNWGAYTNTKNADRVEDYKGMNNHFARLTNLEANTIYYFVIKDNEGVSSRFSFKTIPDNSEERLSFITGGDSRNNRLPRQNANKLVAKLRPHAVFFGGDMTNLNTSWEWQEWMDDWQLTIASDGRMTPIVAARGNHESSNTSIFNLFDTPTSSVYYALNFGGDLIRAYTLNTEISIAGAQTNWLVNDLETNDNVFWKMAQYHKPMRPHVSGKSEGNNQYVNWANPFYENDVRLVIECDAHTVKTTWPVRPSTDNGSDEGFIRDDETGTVYAGEGCWGAPLRGSDDNKEWTRASGQFNQFKWVFVDRETIELRTIKVDNADQVGTVSDNNIFAIPSNLDVWSPSSGAVVVIENQTKNRIPLVEITSPLDGANFSLPQDVTITAEASDYDGTVEKVEFRLDNVLQETDFTYPYMFDVNLSEGLHIVEAKVFDNEGATRTDDIQLSVGEIFQTIEVQVANGGDDVEESVLGEMYVNSSDLELVSDGLRGNQTIGLRFGNLSVPKGARITNAYLQFTTDETTDENTQLTIRGENVDDALPYSESQNDVSSRDETFAAVYWSPQPWNTEGESSTAQRTPNLKNIVQEIVNRSGWSPDNYLSFMISGSGKRIAEAYEGSSSQAPLLHIEYELGGNTVSETFEKRISTSNDDAEQAENGSVYLNSSDIELVYDDHLSAGNQLVGLRFTAVDVPQGATITSAYIQFTVDEVKNSAGSLMISAENTIDASPIAEIDNNLSLRIKTENQEPWSPAVWAEEGAFGEAQRTPDLRKIIQELVDKNGWEKYQSMMFLISGTGQRIAESYDGSASQAPLLHIEYSVPKIVLSNEPVNIDEAAVSVFPNPTEDRLTVDGVYLNKAESVMIYNSFGIPVMIVDQNRIEKNQIDVSSFPTGTYVLYIKSDGKTISKKFVKK